MKTVKTLQSQETGRFNLGTRKAGTYVGTRKVRCADGRIGHTLAGYRFSIGERSRGGRGNIAKRRSGERISTL